VLDVLLAGTGLTSLLLPLVRDPLQLTVARMLFALFVSGLAPTLIRMIKDRAPQGMEARTLSYGTALQQIGAAGAPLLAGVLAPHLGMRGFFWLSSGLIVVGWALWRRAGSSLQGHD
jgi:MFS family permease